MYIARGYYRYSYLLSFPIAFPFFVGPKWDSAAGIQVHARKIKIDWPVPNVKHFPVSI